MSPAETQKNVGIYALGIVPSAEDGYMASGAKKPFDVWVSQFGISDMTYAATGDPGTCNRNDRCCRSPLACRKEIASFAPQSAQVWVGSFNQNAGSWNPSTADAQTRNLHLTATVTFPNAAMYRAFQTSYDVMHSKVPWHFDPHTNTATVKY